MKKQATVASIKEIEKKYFVLKSRLDAGLSKFPLNYGKTVSNEWAYLLIKSKEQLR